MPRATRTAADADNVGIQHTATQPQETHVPISQNLSESREQLLDTAIAAGKIISARRAHYAQMFDRDPIGTTTLIAQLAPGIPQQHASALSAGRRQAMPHAESDYDPRWMSEGERRRVTAARDGDFRRVTKADD